MKDEAWVNSMKRVCECHSAADADVCEYHSAVAVADSVEVSEVAFDVHVGA